MPPKSLYARVARPVRRAVKRRYYNKKTGSVRFNQIARDVQYLKQAINSEKKHIIVYPETVAFAFSNGASLSGHAMYQISPQVISSGTHANQRVGNQLKICSACLEFKLTAQANRQAPFFYKIMLVQKMDCLNGAAQIDDILDKNHMYPSVTVYDVHSQRNQQAFKNFRVIKTVKGTISGEAFDNAVSAERQITVPLKFKNGIMQHYGSSTSTNSERNRIYAIFLGGSGNMDGSSLTGYTATAYAKWYYIDN